MKIERKSMIIIKNINNKGDEQILIIVCFLSQEVKLIKDYKEKQNHLLQ